jgi:hypothetical protein
MAMFNECVDSHHHHRLSSSVTPMTFSLIRSKFQVEMQSRPLQQRSSLLLPQNEAEITLHDRAPDQWTSRHHILELAFAPRAKPAVVSKYVVRRQDLARTAKYEASLAYPNKPKPPPAMNVNRGRSDVTRVDLAETAENIVGHVLERKLNRLLLKQAPAPWNESHREQ